MTHLTVNGDKVKENLELTNGVVMRIHTEHEETRAKAVANAGKNHEVDVAVRKLNDRNRDINQSITMVNQELCKLSASQDTTRDRLGETMETVGTLKNGNMQLQMTMHDLSKSVEGVHNLASTTADHLKMTNSLVLPNLGADAAFAASTTSGHGANLTMNNTTSSRGAMAQTCGPSPRNKNSPRRRKDAAWMNRNIGSVPDRMSWI